MKTLNLFGFVLYMKFNYMNYVFSQKVLYMKNGISKEKKKPNMSKVKRTGVTATK